MVRPLKFARVGCDVLNFPLAAHIPVFSLFPTQSLIVILFERIAADFASRSTFSRNCRKMYIFFLTKILVQIEFNIQINRLINKMPVDSHSIATIIISLFEDEN